MINSRIQLLFFTFIILNFTTCKNVPEFPVQPVITFNKLTVVKNGTNLNLLLSINFTDGDGDLGLQSQDTISPYQAKKDIFGNPTNPDFYNIFYTFLIENENSFKECQSIPTCSTITLNSFYNILVNGIRKDTIISESFADILKKSSSARYPMINTEGKKGPISGKLEYMMIIDDYFLNKKLRFEVFIKDRALNRSNVILTDPILIK